MKIFRNFGRRIRRSLKAVSPVIATLLMIVIAVAASLVAYAWIMGYLGFTTSKVGRAIQIQSITRVDAVTIYVWVQNVGDSSVELDSVYVNGVLDPAATINPNSLGKGLTSEVHSDLYDGAAQVTVKVVCSDGSFMELKKTFTSAYAPGPTEYPLVISTNGIGSVDKSPDEATYAVGETVQLTANADAGWTFSGWSGDLTGSTTPDYVTIDADPQVTATFTPLPIFSDGFESKNFAAWDSQPTRDATIIVTNTLAHHGTYSAVTGGLQLTGEYAWTSKTITPTPLLYHRHYTQFAAVPANSFIIEALSSGPSGYAALVVYSPSTSKWGIVNFHTGTYYWESGTSTFSANTWYCVEIRITRDAAAGMLQLWIDGVQKVNQSNLDTGDSNIDRDYVGGYLTGNEASAIAVYTDCVVMADNYIGP